MESLVTVFISILPILGWGLMPITAKVINGSSRESMLGTTIFVLLTTTVYTILVDINYIPFTFFISFLSGLFWGIGQWLQFEALQQLDVSVAMPLSNGSQLFLTTVISWLFLSEWPGGLFGIIGILCLVAMIMGIYLATKSDKKTKKKYTIRSLFLIFFSSISLAFYVAITKYFNISGVEIFFPQALGMFSVSIVLVGINKEKLKEKKVLQNFVTGFFWIIANLSLFYSSQAMGLGLSFAISQMCVLISIFGGILILKDLKSNQEMRNLKIGSLLMLISIFIFGLTK